MRNILVLGILFSIILIIGCIQNSGPPNYVQPKLSPASTEQTDKPLPEITPVNAQGKLGEEITDKHVKIKVIDYGPIENIDGKDYLLLKVSVENLGDDDLDIYNNFKFFGSLTDNYGQQCSDELVEKYSDVVLPLKLGPKQKAEGILPCPASIDLDGKLNSLNVVLEFNDNLPPEKAYRYAPGSKYGVIKVNVYTYNDIKNMLSASGQSSQEIGTKLAWNSIKVNNYQLLNGIGTLQDYSTREYNFGSECGEDWPGYEYLARDKGLLGIAYTSYSHCQFLKLSITVKNKGYFEHRSDVEAYELGITNLGDRKRATGLDGFNYRTVHKTAFNQLDDPINLNNIKPGEERTGEVIYSVTQYIDLVGGVEKNSMFRYVFGSELKSSLQK